MSDAHSQRIEVFFSNPANLFPSHVGRHNLVKCESVPLRPPRIHFLQQCKEVINGGRNDFMKASNLLPHLFCSFIRSAATERNTLNDFVEAKETVETAV